MLSHDGGKNNNQFYHTNYNSPMNPSTLDSMNKTAATIQLDAGGSPSRVRFFTDMD